MSKESILEQALLQVQNLEEAVKQNAKGILASTMKQELQDLLKESMEEEEEVAEQPIPGLEDEDGMPSDEEGNDDDTSINDEPEKDIDGEDSEFEDEDDTESEEEDVEPEMDADFDDEDDTLDMTDASDEEVLKVFKAMKPEDGIVVKKDGNHVELEDGDDEYIIKLEDEDSSEEIAEEEECHECGDSEMEESESETIYEIDLDVDDDAEFDEEGSEEKEVEESEFSDEEVDDLETEVEEASRTFANDARKPADQGMKYKAGRKEINEEVETLKKQNDEYKKALVLFKDKLNEVAVFNANLAYATRLFTEHSTTRQEKLDILKRFDSVTNMTESKSTYKTIQNELGTKKTVTENVVDKISSNPTTSSSTEVLSEAKAYENPQFKRMKDLMSKL